ncbi:MAG: type IX secretion system membrane protein PorP/SprF [Flavobacteriales bacterium]
MKNLIYIFLAAVSILATATEGLGQQDPMFTQYFFNPLTVNSGYAGTRDALNATILAREQWMGMDGRPRTQTLSIHSPLRNESLAVGGTIINDEVGPTNATSIFADVAYRFKVNETARLAFGVKAGGNLLSADLQGLENTEAADVAFTQNISTRFLPNFGASAYLWADRYFLGLSAPKLLENNLSSEVEDLRGEERTHLFFMGGYVFDLSPALKFKPTFMTKVVRDAPVSVDLTANFLIDDKLWLGAMYRFGDAVGILGSYQITDQLRAGYSYDYTLSQLQTVNNGSHELMLSYDFFFKSEKLLSPRYF